MHVNRFRRYGDRLRTLNDISFLELRGFKSSLKLLALSVLKANLLFVKLVSVSPPPRLIRVKQPIS
jgi:hypothetical protein